MGRTFYLNVAVCAALAVAVAVGCTEPPLPAQPLPALEQPPLPAPVALSVDQLHLRPGERFVWAIDASGASIGQVQLVSRVSAIESLFRTQGLAATLRPLSHRLVTRVARSRRGPTRSSETIRTRTTRTTRAARFSKRSVVLRSAGRERTLVIPGESGAHTLHTVLGFVRAWARESAPPGFTYLVVGDQLYRLDIARPTASEFIHRSASGPVWLIELRATSASQTLWVRVWLTADARRLPLRVVVDDGGDRVTADLIDYTLPR